MYVSRYLINDTFDIFARFNRGTRVNESGNGNERSWVRHYQKKAEWWNNKLELRGREGGRGVSRNRTTLISSVLFTISRQNGDRETGLFRCSSCCNKLPRLSTGKELLARKWNDPLFPFFFFFLLRYSMKLDALSPRCFFPSLCGIITMDRRIVARSRENNKF